jgi:hypothetical protein
MQLPKRPAFALDENFPQPILREAIDKFVLGIEIALLVDIDLSLLGAYQDHELIAELARKRIDGLVTCDDSMVFRPEVLEAIERFGFTLVTCRRVGDDPVRASGLLLVHLPDVAKRYQRRRPQIWRLGTVESRPLQFSEHKKQVEARARHRA